MPKPDHHRAISARNERLVHHLAGSEWSDWAITCIFYAALHELSAFCIERGLGRPADHKGTKRLLRDSGYDQLATIYGTLLSRSHRARYNGSTYAKEHVDESLSLLHQLRVDIAEMP